MKKLALAILLIVVTCNSALAWKDRTNEWNEEVRQAEEENYRNRMLAIQEDLLFLEQQEHDMRMREYWESQND